MEESLKYFQEGEYWIIHYPKLRIMLHSKDRGRLNGLLKIAIKDHFQHLKNFKLP